MLNIFDKKKWNLTKLIATGSLTVFRAIITAVFYTAIIISTGSAFGGLTFVFIGPFFAVLTALIIDQFGSVLLYQILFFITQLPVPSLWPKLYNLAFLPLNGLVMDILYIRIGSKKIFSMLGGFIFTFITSLEMVLLMFTFGAHFMNTMPSFIYEPSWLFMLTLLFSLLGLISGYIAYIVYIKIKNTSIVRRIQR